MNYKIFQYQIYHLIAIVSTIVFFTYVCINGSVLTQGSLFGISTLAWLWIAVLTPIVHQIYVAIIWRYELYKKTFSKKYGFEKAFKSYAMGFSILFLFRLISLIF